MIISILRPAMESFQPMAEGMNLNGATLSDARSLRALANADGIEALEVFLLPRDMLPVERLAQCAESLLEPKNRGKGRLRFHAIHNLPAVWSDGAERMVFCQDLYLLGRDRYVRDRFAKGPTVLVSDVHCLGHRDIWTSFRELAKMEKVDHDRIVATSSSIAAGIETSFQALQAEPPRFTVWHRSIDLDTFQPVGTDGKAFARRTLKLPPTANIALFLSRLTPNDKADLMPLIDAFADVATENDLLLIAGVENASGYARALIARAQQRRVNVEIRTDVPRGMQTLFYSAADFFVFPGDTIQEAIPTAIAEAMACGLAVVGSDWDGIRDLVQPEVTGILVPTVMTSPPDEVGALLPLSDFLSDFLIMGQSVVVDRSLLSQAIKRLLRDPELRAQMGAKGREFAEQKLKLTDWTRGMVELGSELLRQAANEPESGPERRRIASENSPMAMPFGPIFAHYATRTLQPHDVVELTEAGVRALNGQESPAFYDATLPYLSPTLVPSLLRSVQANGRVETVLSRTAIEGQVDEGRARFALALLLKHGFLSLKG